MKRFNRNHRFRGHGPLLQKRDLGVYVEIDAGGRLGTGDTVVPT
jgi:hypothetical protein